MKTAALACLLLASCADLKLAGVSIETPYGTITGDGKGNYSVALKPIVIREEKSGPITPEEIANRWKP